MFTCTECGQCLSACDQVQQGNPAGGLLQWVEGEQALPLACGRKQAVPVRRDTAEA
jgi:Fe-S oxidoreductase